MVSLAPGIASLLLVAGLIALGVAAVNGSGPPAVGGLLLIAVGSLVSMADRALAELREIRLRVIQIIKENREHTPPGGDEAVER